MPYDKIKHGRSKLISNYGGVGSLIETQDCSVIVETFDNWLYNDLQSKLSTYIIRDDRLLYRLRNRFPNIRHIVQIPTERNTLTDRIGPSANYFSKWFYCPHLKCSRFAEVSEWRRRWIAAGKNPKYFNPPKCSNDNCREEVLEQIRFVVTCKDGHIDDIPWRHWNNRLSIDQTNLEADENEEDASARPRGPQLDFSTICCESQDLQYQISKENTELSGIWVVCRNCGKKESLKGIFNYQGSCRGKKYWLGMVNGKFADEGCEQKTKVVVKASNSVYYSNALSSIYVPGVGTQLSVPNEVRIEIDNLLDSGEFTKEEIIKSISISKGNISKDIIRSYLETGNAEYIAEDDFRKGEYDYMLKEEQSEEKELRCRSINCQNTISGFSRLVKVEKLKKTTVQTSFTRQEPIDVDSILQDKNSYEYDVKRQSVSKNNFDTRLLPGVESYGEGILFVLDYEQLNQWESQASVIDRTNLIKKNAEESSWLSHKIVSRTLRSRKLLIHTLSHLLIRELEFVCGYPVSSLQERLYTGEAMHGFLISAFDGTDGYLGGLASLCNDLEKLNSIVQSAIHRATDCSSDPICMESSGQGVSQLNLAACHSCALLPETTCELSNLFMDRRMVVDAQFGYCKSSLQV